MSSIFKKDVDRSFAFLFLLYIVLSKYITRPVVITYILTWFNLHTLYTVNLIIPFKYLFHINICKFSTVIIPIMSSGLVSYIPYISVPLSGFTDHSI